MTKLPVFATVGEAVEFTFSNLGTLIAISWKWLLLVLIPATLIPGWIMISSLEALAQAPAPGTPQPPIPDETMRSLAAVSVIASLATIPALASIAVNWHRFVLRRERATGLSGLRLDAPVWRYIGVGLLLMLLTMMPFLVLAPDQLQPGATRIRPEVIIGLLVVSLVLSVVALRLSMVLPGVAVQNPNARLANVWRATRGHTWRLLAIVLVIAVAAYLALLVVGLIVLGVLESGTKEPPIAAMSTMMLVSFVLNHLFGVVVLSFMSIGYRHFYESGQIRG